MWRPVYDDRCCKFSGRREICQFQKNENENQTYFNSPYLKIRHLYNRKTKKSYTGLLNQILEIFDERGEDYEIIRIPASYVPSFIIKNLKEIIEFIVDNRNFDNRFRDTRWDKYYLEQYLSLQHQLRRCKK